jgi:hypothetical protein
MAALRKALISDTEDTENGPKTRSLNKLLHELNNFAAISGRHPGLNREGFEADRKFLERFKAGQEGDREYLYRLLWDFYISNGIIKDTDFPNDINAFVTNSSNFFMQNNRNLSGNKESALLSHYSGWFYGYKRAIRNPDNIIIKYLANIQTTVLSDSIMILNEYHFNRTFKPPTSDVIKEFWTGIILMRDPVTQFGMIRENIRGTPKSCVFHSPQPADNDDIVQIFGDGVEVVERWGDRKTLQSRFILERIPTELIDKSVERNVEMLGEACDLIDKNALYQLRPDIVLEIMPNTAVQQRVE